MISVCPVRGGDADWGRASDGTVGSVRGTLKPRGRVPRPGLKIIKSAAMIAATVTAAAATVGAVLVIGPGAAGGPGY